MEEKVYLESDKVKVTDLKVYFGKDSIPIMGITEIDTNLRAPTLFLSCAILFISFLVILYSAQLTIFAVVLSFILVRWEYEHYLELIVVLDSRRIKIMTASMGNRDCVYQIAKAIDMAIADNRRRLNLSGVSETETMQSRRLHMQAEKLDTSGLEIKRRKEGK